MEGSIFTPDARFEPWWWRAAPPEAAPVADLPEKADVVVVGAGYTGLMAATILARAGRRVLVLEASNVGDGASSRAGGMIGSGHRVGYGALCKRYGHQTAIANLGEGLKALDYTTGMIAEEGISCGFSRSGRFRAAWRPGDYDALGWDAERQRELTGLQVVMVPKSEQHREVATDSYHGGCVFPSHGALHPALFLKGLLERTRAAGATVAGHTPVLAIEARKHDVEMVTGRGRIAAASAVIAANGYAASVSPYLGRRVIPVFSHMIATEELPETLVRGLIPGARMIVETRARHCYYRRSPDDRRLLFGGRVSVREIDPRRGGRVLRRLMVELFPELDGVAIDHAWDGRLGFSADHMPHIGRHGRIFFAVGLSGSGMAMAPYLGYRVANKVLGTPEGACAFDALNYPAVPLHFGLPLAMPFVDLYFRGKDILEGSS
ncbi:MAG: FAD-binding oxidoreductase [bacterium]|nr:FAD-binding oxidoreductase [bacterium]